MRDNKRTRILWAVILLCVSVHPISASRGRGRGTSYTSLDVAVVAVVPKTAFIGHTLSIPITTTDARSLEPKAVPVAVMLRDSRGLLLDMAVGVTDSQGRWVANLEIPATSPGTLNVEIIAGGAGQVLMSQVKVGELPVLFVETDKPIYKPGQTIHGRVLLLDQELKPLAGEVTVQIQDAKGIKVFRKDMETNAFGVAPFDLDLATELNMGTWKIKAQHASLTGQVDVRVETYVLPRFEVLAELDRDYYLVNEAVTGVIEARYFFGKPVAGRVEITARKYVGKWEAYATFTASLEDGHVVFELPPVEYVSGTPKEGGGGALLLDITAIDTSDHTEETSVSIAVARSHLRHQVIPLAKRLIPGQSLDLLLVAETPVGKPVTASARCEYYFERGGQPNIPKEVLLVADFDGVATVTIPVPDNATTLYFTSSVENDSVQTRADVTLSRGYSPSNCFIHLRAQQASSRQVGQTAQVDVFQTHERTVYYDVFARGHTLFSGATRENTLAIPLTAQMFPHAKLVAYVIGPDNEIAADTLDLSVQWQSDSSLDLSFDMNEALPGQDLQLLVQAESQAMVGLAVVDESVYALNAGRLNMEEVMEMLETKFMEPQQETHSSSNISARDIFERAGLNVITNSAVSVPGGSVSSGAGRPGGGSGRSGGGSSGARTPTPAPTPSEPLVEVTYVRQFFPETWVWMPDLLTDETGFAALDLTAPDNITTWAVHAVSTSDRGMAVGESELLVFQEFFGEPDLPYSVTRGDRFPLRVQIFNYLDVDQTVHVTLKEDDWFTLLEPAIQQVHVPANTVGLASYEIEATELGRHLVEVTLQTTLRADAVRKPLLVEPEGTAREQVTNGLIEAGQSVVLNSKTPAFAVPGSGKRLLNITPSFVGQSIQGLDSLLHMPCGCGEQNMIYFAPDVEVVRYLDASDQLTPEIRAKAEHYMTVGYQRELTFRHSDGSFSAFGERDRSGSLWLTAFVLGTFSGARDVQTIDENVLAAASAWIAGHQLASGAWEQVGFLCHRGMAGGVSGNFTLTAYVLNALLDYGQADNAVLTKAADYLTDNLSQVQDHAFGLAIASLALQRLGREEQVIRILDRLNELAIYDHQGLHWDGQAIETTAYVTLTMVERFDSRVTDTVQWLALQQNSLGGYRSTQDTVMALKALMQAARFQSRNVDLNLVVRQTDGTILDELSFDESNFDVLQTVVLPSPEPVTLSAQGRGRTRYQLVDKYSVWIKEGAPGKDLSLEVLYDTNQVAVNDIVNVQVTVRYLGRELSTGMMIVDVGVPTGFESVQSSLDALLNEKTVSRIEQAGRKVIFYVDELTSGETRRFSFQVQARWPVRAMVPDSQTYLYYEPEISAEVAGQEMVVEEGV